MGLTTLEAIPVLLGAELLCAPTESSGRLSNRISEAERGYGEARGKARNRPGHRRDFTLQLVCRTAQRLWLHPDRFELVRRAPVREGDCQHSPHLPRGGERQSSSLFHHRSAGGATCRYGGESQSRGLRSLGGLYLRPEDHPKDQSVAQYKSGDRAKIVAKGYRIVLNVGDQMSDLVLDPQADHSVKLPNPFYLIP